MIRQLPDETHQAAVPGVETSRLACKKSSTLWLHHLSEQRHLRRLLQRVAVPAQVQCLYGLYTSSRGEYASTLAQGQRCR